ncbi:MAG: cadmium resistance transporter [Gammaproteobacteria bacterium]|nr:cadmium resistance transporter [Gammaproteobacteria bacterium]
MVGALTIIVLATGTFAATNVDNLVLLVGWMLSGRVPRHHIFIGYALGMAALLAIAFGLGFSSNAIPVQYLGYLGIIPILLGAKMIVDLRREANVDVDNPEEPNPQGSIFAIASTQLANGVDTILVFSPLLADSRGDIDYLIVGCFVVMVAVWFGVAQLLTLHASRLKGVAIAGRWLAPLVMILVGLYILDNTATDLLAGD